MQELPKAKSGFQSDYRVAGYDEIAEIAVRDVLGESYLNSIKEKFHRAVPSLSGLVDDLLKYDTRYASSETRNDSIYQLSLQSVREDIIPQVKLIPWTFRKVELHPDFPRDKSACIPWSQLGYKNKGEVLEDEAARNTWRLTWDKIGRGKAQHLHDVALYCRAQVCPKDKNKLRAVWGYPMSVIMEEGRYFYPFLEYISRADVPIAYGVEMANGGMQYVNDMLVKQRHANHMCVDYSQFDSTVPPWMIRDAFQIILDCFDLRYQEGENGYRSDDEDRIRNRFKRMVKYFIQTPIRAPDARRWRKSGGVPSGSNFTNIIDSIVNMIVMRYAIYQTTGNFPTSEMYLGDDSIVSTPYRVSLTEIAELVKDKFGMKVNMTKSFITDRPNVVEFLGFRNENGFPQKNQETLVASWVMPERYYDPASGKTAVRCLGQMYACLQPRQAYYWYLMLERVLGILELSIEDMLDIIKKYPNQFKWLRQIGVVAEDMTIPRPSANKCIYEVLPRYNCTREWKPKCYNTLLLFASAERRQLLAELSDSE